MKATVPKLVPLGSQRQLLIPTESCFLVVENLKSPSRRVKHVGFFSDVKIVSPANPAMYCGLGSINMHPCTQDQAVGKCIQPPARTGARERVVWLAGLFRESWLPGALKGPQSPSGQVPFPWRKWGLRGDKGPVLRGPRVTQVWPDPRYSGSQLSEP